jgi:biopolymer transport protein TolR
MGASLGTNRVMAEMNLTPLIDIVLVVLIIMMVNIPIQVEEMGIKLPSNVKVQVPTEIPPEQLVIAVYEDGSLALNRRLMTEEVLFYEVTRRLRPMAHKNVFIDAAPNTEYGRVVDMMDLSREAGASKVGLARLKPDGPLPATSVAPGSMPKGVHVGLAITVGVLSQRQADRSIKPFMATYEACYE